MYPASRPMIDEMGSSPPLTQKILCLIPYFHNSNQSDKLKIGFMKCSILKKVLYEIPHTDWIQTILDNIIASFSMKYPELIPGSNCLLKFKLIEINTETKEYTIIIIIHHFNGFFFNLAQQQSGDLAMVYSSFHPMIAQIGSSPPYDPDNLYIFISNANQWNILFYLPFYWSWVIKNCLYCNLNFNSENYLCVCPCIAAAASWCLYCTYGVDLPTLFRLTLFLYYTVYNCTCLLCFLSYINRNKWWFVFASLYCLSQSSVTQVPLRWHTTLSMRILIIVVVNKKEDPDYLFFLNI